MNKQEKVRLVAATAIAGVAVAASVSYAAWRPPETVTLPQATVTATTTATRTLPRATVTTTKVKVRTLPRATVTVRVTEKLPPYMRTDWCGPDEEGVG